MSSGGELTTAAATVDVKRPQFELVDRRDFGCPRKLTARVFIKICRRIEMGSSMVSACQAEHVTYRIFRLRVANNDRLARRVKQAEQQRANVRFEHACESIMQAGETSWMAHAWWLERSYPQLFALRTVNRTDPEAKQIEPELPAEILAHHRRLMLAMLRESETPQLPDSEQPDSEHSTK